MATNRNAFQRLGQRKKVKIVFGTVTPTFSTTNECILSFDVGFIGPCKDSEDASKYK